MEEVLYCAFCQGDQTIRRGKILFVSEVLYAFKNESKFVASAKKVHNIQKRSISRIERDELFRFLDDSGFNVSFFTKNGEQIGFD